MATLIERYEVAVRQGMAPIEGVRWSKGGKPYVVQLVPVGGPPFKNERWNARKHAIEASDSRGESVVDYHSCIRLVGRLVGEHECRMAQAETYHLECLKAEGRSFSWEAWASKVFAC